MTNSSPRNVRRRVLGQYGRVQKFVLGTSYTFMYNDQPKIMASIQACPDTLLIQSSPERPAGKQLTNRASLYRDADATARVSTRNGRDQSPAPCTQHSTLYTLHPMDVFKAANDKPKIMASIQTTRHSRFISQKVFVTLFCNSRTHPLTYSLSQQ